MFDGSGANLALAALFGAVLFLVCGLASLAGANSPVRRRLAGKSQRPSGTRRRGSRVSLRTDAMHAGGWRQLLDPLDEFLLNRQRSAWRYMRSRFLKADIADPLAPRIYLLTQILCAIAVPAVVFVCAPALFIGAANWQAAVPALVLAGGGFLLPNLWLARLIGRRQRRIAASFPDALDMMVVCVEAGLGLDATLARVGTHLAPVHPLLAVELERVTLELRAGKSRDEALRNFAERVSLPEVASFVTLLVQSEALGVGIAQTLRAHGDDMRANRLLRAEEMAHKLPVKLTVPLVLCLLPAMLVAVLLPGMLSIVRNVLPGLGQ